MITVSNTSPISNLAMIGRLDLIRRVYGPVVIPGAVREELKALRDVQASELIQKAEADAWLTTKPVSDPKLVNLLNDQLDPGEAEAIALAIEHGGRLLIDELDGRRAARRFGVPVRGALWVLRQGKRLGWVESLREEIMLLRTKANFWISPDLEARFLADAGE
jgi:predicted nucleic acid-binding protein